MSFNDVARPGKCEVCGKVTDVVVCSSTMGAISFAYCKDCLEAGAEPYTAMVSFIACAGHYPDDINEQYRAVIESNLAYLGKSKSDFIHDVDQMIDDIDKW